MKRHFVAAVCSLLFPFRPTPPHDISFTLVKQPNQVAKHSPFTSLGVRTCNATADVGQLLGFSTGVWNGTLFSCLSQKEQVRLHLRECHPPALSCNGSAFDLVSAVIHLGVLESSVDFHLGIISVYRKKITCLETAVFSPVSVYTLLTIFILWARAV